MSFYNKSMDLAISQLGSDRYSGLSEIRALELLVQYGPNKLTEGKRAGPLRIFFDQFKNILVGVLLAAAVVSGLTHDLTDSFVILAIALINAVIGFLQEYPAERDMEAIPAKAKELTGAWPLGVIAVSSRAGIGNGESAVG
ncbi:MAG: cation-transporting P-type ATPase [bacterium]|nr:cation-transporting P-type ATPase [bacterium]